MKLKLLTVFFISVVITGCYNGKADTKIQACFTPGENCTESIVNVINQAKTSLLIQADNFSSEPIIQATIAAKQRNVDVKILFDKALWTNQNATAALLLDNKIAIALDKKVRSANNNIIIVDNAKVITGSFDFTREAQEKNADNLLIVENESIGKRYADNWQSRAVVAETVTALPKAEKPRLALNKNRYRKPQTQHKKAKQSHFWFF